MAICLFSLTQSRRAWLFTQLLSPVHNSVELLYCRRRRRSQVLHLPKLRRPARPTPKGLTHLVVAPPTPSGELLLPGPHNMRRAPQPCRLQTAIRQEGLMPPRCLHFVLAGNQPVLSRLCQHPWVLLVCQSPCSYTVICIGQRWPNLGSRVVYAAGFLMCL